MTENPIDQNDTTNADSLHGHPPEIRCSRGFELLLRKAATDKDLRVALKADPLQAAEKVGVYLTEEEGRILQGTSGFSLAFDSFGKPFIQEAYRPKIPKRRWSHGIELLVTRAADDKDFRVALLADPLQAAKSIGVQLDEAE